MQSVPLETAYMDDPVLCCSEDEFTVWGGRHGTNRPCFRVESELGPPLLPEQRGV